MFDLNRALADWRQDMHAQRTLSGADLDELEDHLREEIAQLTGQGLSEEEAFQVARMRLGSPRDLGGEFAMADPAGRRSFRLRWMVVGALALVALWLGSGVVTGLVAALVGMAQSRGVLPEAMPALGLGFGVLKLLVLALGCVILWRLLVTDRSSRGLSRLDLPRIVLIGLVLGFLFVVAGAMPGFFMARGLTQPAFLNVAMAGAYFRLAMLLILPLFLLVVLWRLVRN